jgi:hypothetical protein
MISLNDILKGHGFSSAFGDATAAQILNGKKATTSSGLVTGTMPNQTGADKAALSVLGNALQIVKLQAPAGFYDGNTWIYMQDPDFIAANILSGVNIFGLAGTLVQGKKWASGSARANGNTQFSVTGLTFAPSKALIYSNQINGAYYNYLIAILSKNADIAAYDFKTSGYDALFAVGGSNAIGYNLAPNFLSDGFNVSFGIGSGWYVDVGWFAYE